MDEFAVIKEIEQKNNFTFSDTAKRYADEIHLCVREADFKKACLGLHKLLNSTVAMLWAQDERRLTGAFGLYACFMGVKYKKWFFVRTNIPQEKPFFQSLARDIYSASLFERQVKEMFGLTPVESIDQRSLGLHEEVWPVGSPEQSQGCFPLRKDFRWEEVRESGFSDYVFNKVEGEGIFEVPVGPVHAGIIGPGHFRFSVAGEPIINLELRLGWTHRGVEKIFEGRSVFEAVSLAERVCGDSSFAHSLAFCLAIEKICAIGVGLEAACLRAIFIELERMSNHVDDIGGMAIDVGFSFPAAYAAVLKESILELNRKLTGNRYLRGVNVVGGVGLGWDEGFSGGLKDFLKSIAKDFAELKRMLFSSISFMDRVDHTGTLKKKTAQDLGILGLAARASGISLDLRKDFPGVYQQVKFNIIKEEGGDCLARLRLRIAEFQESLNLIPQFLDKLKTPVKKKQDTCAVKAGSGLGYAEAHRGPALYWVEINEKGLIERCKITDASFHNWPGLSFSVLGDIIPDFPLCNKSFDLSYAGNDL